MPHALIGYAGDTVKAVEMTRERWPERPIVALVDYFAREVTDALAVCRRLRARREVAIRSTRRASAMSRAGQRPRPRAGRHPRAGPDLNDPHLIGPGVSAAAVLYIRAALDQNGFTTAKIVCSSGFNAVKCQAWGGRRAGRCGRHGVLRAGRLVGETYATPMWSPMTGVRRVKAGANGWRIWTPLALTRGRIQRLAARRRRRRPWWPGRC